MYIMKEKKKKKLLQLSTQAQVELLPFIIEERSGMEFPVWHGGASVYSGSVVCQWADDVLKEKKKRACVLCVCV